MALAATLMLLGLILLQGFYLAEHVDWALSHPVKGAHWPEYARHTTEHPSDYLPGGYSSQNLHAILMFMAGAIALPLLLHRLRLLRSSWVALLTVICLLTFFAVSILHSEQRYYQAIDDRIERVVELAELVRLPMRTVPKGHCEERIVLRLLDADRTWSMHLKCDTGLTWRITQNAPEPGERFRIEIGKDRHGNTVLLTFAPAG